MRNTSAADRISPGRRGLLGMAALVAAHGPTRAQTGAAPTPAGDHTMNDNARPPEGGAPPTPQETAPRSGDPALTALQRAIGPVAAATATGDMARLGAALERALDAGLTVSEIKEVLVQLYAYVGFPRSLNALTAFMQLLQARRQRGIQDAPGREPGPLPAPQQMLAVGTANQTRLSGAPVRGPLFEFAPAIDQYLKTHLFGDIFARDNLDWRQRELATVAALSALSGVASQLQAHVRISLNVGLTVAQLRQLATTLADAGHADAGQRLLESLDSHPGG